jgi:hypothetical protein
MTTEPMANDGEPIHPEEAGRDKDHHRGAEHRSTSALITISEEVVLPRCSHIKSDEHDLRLDLQQPVQLAHELGQVSSGSHRR